jgi:hypothetical protein
MAALPPVDEAADIAVGKAADTGVADKGITATMARSISVTDRSGRLHAQTSCDDLSGSFLAPQCQFGKAGKLHMTRSARSAANHRIATIPIGRADATLQVDQQKAEQQTEQPRAAASRSALAAPAAPAVVTTNEAPTVLPPEKPAAPAKKPVKTAHKQTPSRDNAGADAMAAAPSPGFGLFGLFHEPPHTGNGVWAMSW